MEMWEVIIKNNGVTPYLVEDLGISVPSASFIDFHDQFTYDEIAGSDDLRDAVTAASLVVNNGIIDLPATSGSDYLTIENIYHLEDNYYNKVELGTSGESEVHWDNITNAPSFTEGNTLDDAYNEGGAGAGRTVIVDSGSVQLSAADGGYSPLELTEQGVLPANGLAGGQLAVKAGILYTYDSTRSKWLSVQRMFLTFGRKGLTKDQFLNFGAGTLPSNNAGYRLARNATIVSITGQLDATGSCDFRVRSNDSSTNIVSLNLAAVAGNQDATINVDINSGDFLQSYLDAGTKVADPITVIEIAWR